jgi:catechol 2,3-dioxygenase-like lactoylglutathione lyase family enzyme
MIDHITVRVRDLEKSKAFYAKALEPLGYQVVKSFGALAGLGTPGKPDFWIGTAEGKPQEPMHIAFRARTRLEVEAFHEAAIKAGAKDNGKPGVRKDYHPNYYGAFVIDPDGHNLEVVCHQAQER